METQSGSELGTRQRFGDAPYRCRNTRTQQQNAHRAAMSPTLFHRRELTKRLPSVGTVRHREQFAS